MERKEIVKLANELLKEHGFDCFDEEGYVDEKAVESLIATVKKYLSESS